MMTRREAYQRCFEERQRLRAQVLRQATAPVHQEVERLRAALERLGSSEAMTNSFAIDKTTNEGRELDARLTFAREALKAEDECHDMRMQAANEIERLRAALWRIGHNICISEGSDKQMAEIAREALEQKL